MNATQRLLIVDDEHNIRAGLAAALAGDGRIIDSASNGAEALAAVENAGRYDIVVTDLKMPGKVGGLELVRRIRQKTPDAAIIVITAYGTVETAVEAMKLGAFDYLSKPIDIKHLRTVVRNALEKQKLLGENRLLRRRLSGEREIIAAAGEMRKVFDVVAQVAASDVTVLITGESGTGKEVVARAIHDGSRRRDKPFVGANCSALPESLFESEMFGHEKGAFTGAVRRHAGRFELADGGTLFLDEVADMPLQYQVDLLRVLEQREIRRIGGEQALHVDVRVISATNRNLRQAVSDGVFREDLYYRLNVIPIHIPALRERPDDIPLLVDAFLAEFNAVHGKDVRLSDRAHKALYACNWPGNVRELRNVIERIVVTTPQGEVGPAGLPDEVRFGQQQKTLDLETAVREAERSAIVAALNRTDNRQEAAGLLGVSVRTLQYKLRSLGLLDEKEDGQQE